MIEVRRSNDRGKAEFGWLSSRHTFSFGDYYDRNHMGFGPLRVINEDRVAPGKGFARHPHRDMEILSYVVDGALEHKDSMGNGSVVTAGELQRMSAGTGVTHSEYNRSADDGLHFLQIWIEPERSGAQPEYEQRIFSDEDKRGKLKLVASREGRDGSITVHQDADLYASILGPGEAAEHRFDDARAGWLQVVRGTVDVDGETLGAGDGASWTGSNALRISQAGADNAEFLLFDLGV